MARIALATLFLLTLLPEAPAQEAQLDTEEKKISYTIGVTIGRQMNRNRVELDPDVFARGIIDALKEQELQLSDAEMEAAMQAFERKQILSQMPQEQRAVAEANGAAAQKYLAENAKKEGVVALPSGLQYQVLKAGRGPKPTVNDRVKTHYHGTLADGSVFDSSVERGTPATFPVGGVIPGWVEALQLMPVGSKWKLFVPADLAYGLRGSPPKIGPNQMLIFEVELLEIVE